MIIYSCIEKFNPLAAGGMLGKQWHLEYVPVVFSHLPVTSQLATDTDSRCFFHVNRKSEPAVTKQKRAEPLARPCSFALSGLPAEGTLSTPRQNTHHPAIVPYLLGKTISRLQRYRLWLCLYSLYNGQSTTRLNPNNEQGRATPEGAGAHPKCSTGKLIRDPSGASSDIHILINAASDAETGAVQNEQNARVKSRRTHLISVRTRTPTARIVMTESSIRRGSLSQNLPISAMRTT